MGKETNYDSESRRNERMRFIVGRGSPQFVGATQALRIVRMIDDWASPAEIAAEAAREPTLAEGIVQLAASALYGSAEVRSLQAAVEFLGYEEMRRAMLTLAVSAWEPPQQDSAAFDMQEFRRRAVCLAYMSEAVARHLRLEHATSFFLAGMFADIGYMFLAMHTPYAVRHISLTQRRTPNVTLFQAEYYTVGFTHGELSAVAAEEFGFAPELIEAVRFHEQPSRAPYDSRQVADVVHVASCVLDQIGVRVADCLPAAVAEPGSCERLGLSIEAVQAQVEGVLERSDIVMGTIKSTLAA